MPTPYLLFLQFVLIVLQGVWLFLPMLTALLVGHLT
jgi:hypothetical protein